MSANTMGRIGPRELLEVQLADGRDDEEDRAHRGRHHADREVEYEGHGEVQGVDPDLVRQRGEHRHQDDHRGQGVDEHPADQDEDRRRSS